LQVGSAFVTAINTDNEVYNWGRGEYGVFGDGRNKSLSLPEKNYYFDLLK
jgi:alpha-tubulin suppressor-like RCC1 family protein